MKCVRLHGPNDVRIEQLPKPQVGKEDVLVRVAACGICGSDLGYIAAGGLIGPTENPMPLGHELAGTIVEVGSDVKDLAEGTRVVVNPMEGGNMIGNGGPQGGFAEFLLVRNAAKAPCVVSFPEGLPFERAALTEPLGVALHAVNQGMIQPSEKVAVLGAGPIGLGVIVALRYRGVSNVVAVDFSAKRLELAKAVGAKAVWNPREGETREFLSSVQGTETYFGFPVVGTDVYIDATGVGQVVQDFLGMAKCGARLVVVGLHKHEVPIDLRTVLAKELTLRGSMAYPTEFPQIIEMLRDVDVPADRLISHEFEFDEFEAALKIAQNAEVSGKVMIRFPSA